jgi:SAM-dependent methyltransferase
MTPVTKLSDVSETEFPGIWYEFAGEDHFWCKARLRAFARLLRDKGIDTQANWRGFEVGCGNGLVRRQIETLTRWTLDGTDLCLPALQQNNTKRGETFLYNIHDRLPQLANAYDFIVLWDVLEHIDQPVSFLQSVLHHLKPGGLFFLNVPALESLRSQYDTAAGHVRRYDHELFTAEAKQANLEVLESRYWGFSMVPMLLTRKLMFSLRRNPGTEEIIRSGFRPPHPLINTFLNAWMGIDQALIGSPFIGTSLMAMARKPLA